MILATAALLLEALPLVVAHGHGDETSGSSMDMENAAQPSIPDGDVPHSYWSLPEHTSLIFAHIVLEIIAWFVVLPVGMLPEPIHSLCCSVLTLM